LERPKRQKPDKTKRLNKFVIMKKTILALAVFAMSATSFNAFAQTDGNKGQVECCVSGNVCVNNRPSAKECRMQKMFDGITLTADQQANISKLAHIRMDFGGIMQSV